jgi:hypothetical protein
MASIQGIYIALFGRPADPAGLAFWTAATNGGQNLTPLRAMTQTPEYLNRFAGKTAEEIVTSIYQSLFGRLPDAGGLEFFTDALENGSLDTIAIQILDGAQGSDALIVENKETAADLFTASLDTPEEIAAYSGENAILNAQNLLSDVTEDPSSIPTAQDIDAAIQTLDEEPAPQDEDDDDAPPVDGGGGPSPADAATLTAGSLEIASGANATLSGTGSVVVSASGFSPVSFDLADISSFDIGSNSSLTIAASNIGSRTVNGTGSLNLTGVTFTEAAAGGGFEVSPVLDGLIADLLVDSGVAGAVSRLSVNGDKADAFKVLWDFLDDQYVGANNFYVATLNENFVRLGVEYVKYLQAGGDPLTSTTAKFTADSGDVGTAPDREQSMHDNLLGNATLVNINDRFVTGPSPNPTLALELSNLVNSLGQGYATRPIYSGNEGARGGLDHDGARAFDFDKGFERDDYFDSYFGTVDPLASDDRNGDQIDEQMFYGTGNSITAFNVLRHEGAGFELALKAKEFGPNGGDYDLAGSTPANGEVAIINGVAHYNVSSGASPDNGSRADWSIDYAATTLPAGVGDDLTYKIFIDIDETENENLVEVPMTVFNGLQQGSTNYGFGFIAGAIDTDDALAGVQSYSFGPGEFSVELRAFDGTELIGVNKIVVHVDGFGL